MLQAQLEVLWVPYKNYPIFAVALHYSNVSGLENLFVVVSLSIKIKIKIKTMEIRLKQNKYFVTPFLALSKMPL